MALLGLRDVSFSYTASPFLEHASLVIEPGERIALLGRNGVGKSTLLKIVDGTIRPDHGEVVRQSGIRITRLDQEVPASAEGSIFELVADGLGETGQMITRYHRVTEEVARRNSPQAMAELGRLHALLDRTGAWEIRSRVETITGKLGLDPEESFAAASGGRKRQALLARALVSKPDLLLLDEPTNHLDIGRIEWLESFLLDQAITLFFITHDRAFLQRNATRIVELDRGRLIDWGAGYQRYLERKEAALEAEAHQQAEFDRKLAEEEIWLRQGIKARRTRNEGRVRALEAMREERAARRERSGSARLQMQEAGRSGRLVAETRGLGYAVAGRQIIADCSTTIMRGDRVGIIGPNGAGKTTLLKLLLGELQPTVGEVRLGTNLEVIYSDQLRETLDPALNLMQVVSPGDQVEVGGQRRHVISYLQDFLFTAEQTRSPVRNLSGGERNRLLLARLFTRPGNLLVMDEPTNDLDLETLELLEDLLGNFSGTLILVSHDRTFLDHLVTQSLVLGPGGVVREYVGGYSDWLRQRDPDQPPPTRQLKPVAPAQAIKRKPLTLAERAELEGLPSRIDAADQLRNELYLRMSDPELLRDGQATLAVRGELADAESSLEELMRRWEALEEKAAGS